MGQGVLAARAGAAIVGTVVAGGCLHVGAGATVNAPSVSATPHADFGVAPPFLRGDGDGGAELSSVSRVWLRLEPSPLSAAEGGRMTLLGVAFEHARPVTDRVRWFAMGIASVSTQRARTQSNLDSPRGGVLGLGAGVSWYRADRDDSGLFRSQEDLSLSLGIVVRHAYDREAENGTFVGLQLTASLGIGTSFGSLER